MRTLIVRLAAAFAVLLMPLGMAAAPASAALTPHHAAQAGMPMGHCPDQGSRPDTKSGLAGCLMACAASLPTVGGAVNEPLKPLSEPALPPAAERLLGLHPDTATPPPKRT